MCAVYEAGPTGSGLARKAAGHSLNVEIAAPGRIPRFPGEGVKADRREAERLGRVVAAGELSFVSVPSAAEERFRAQAGPAKTTVGPAPSALTSRRQRLRSTTTWDRWRHSPSARGWWDRVIAEAATGIPQSETIARLGCFCGLGSLTEAVLSAEVGDFRRFGKPAQLAGCLGITRIRAHLR